MNSFIIFSFRFSLVHVMAIIIIANTQAREPSATNDSKIIQPIMDRAGIARTFEYEIFQEITEACAGDDRGVSYFRDMLLSDSCLRIFEARNADRGIALSEYHSWQAIAAVEAGRAMKPKITRLLIEFYYGDMAALKRCSDEEIIKCAVSKLVGLMTSYKKNNPNVDFISIKMSTEKGTINTDPAKIAVVHSSSAGLVFRTVLQRQSDEEAYVWIPVGNDIVTIK